MRKIAFISSNEYIPWGGSEYCWAATAEKFARRGAEVRVSVKRWDRPVPQVEHLRRLGCRVFLRPPPTLSRRVMRKALRLREYAWRHMRILGRDTDLVVISQGENHDGLSWMEAARAHGYRYATIAEGAPDSGFPDDSVAARFAASYNAAAAAYFVSEANIALSRRQFATPLLNARVIRNPFNVSYDANPPWPNFTSDCVSLACVGRLDVATKRQDLICEVLSLPHWRARNIQVSFVGAGPNEQSLRWLVETRSLRNVNFTGSIDDIEKIWRDHHALLLTSRHEGMPLTVVEAMLCGRPCIVTDVGGNRELVRDGTNGFIAKAATIELIDEAMCRAWESRRRLREMGEQAAVDVRRWVSPDPVADFVRELESLLAGTSLVTATAESHVLAQ